MKKKKGKNFAKPKLKSKKDSKKIIKSKIKKRKEKKPKAKKTKLKKRSKDLKKRSILEPKGVKIRESTKTSQRVTAKPLWKSFKLPKLKRKVTKKKVPSKSKVKPGKRAFKLSRPIIDARFTKKLIFLGVISSVFIWLFWGIPLPTKLSTEQVPVSTKLFDRNGNLIYEIYADRRSTPIKLDDLPDHVKQSTIAIEDKDFYKHYGVSFTGVVRAAFNTAFKKKLQGGSTLTQQLVKNALLTPERTVKRKIREFALTLVVETIYSKDQIFELYLNQIPYGSTAYGIGAASELYFGKEAKDLTLAETALLAGLPAAPSRYSPFGSRPELAKGRQETVLRRMVEDGYISQEEADKAKEEEVKFAEPESLKAPHFALWVKELLAEEYGESVVEKGGLRVTTTLDLELQDFAQNAVATEVAKLKKQKVGNGAALVTKPTTGEILAMVGSKDYFAEDEDGKVNIIFASRQPGSSIKPINYALALKDGKITLSTVLADAPTCFTVFGQKNYCPVNYDGQFHGAVQARFALGSSYNIPAVKVLALNGIENFIEFATKMGITTFTDPANYGLSLTLGGGEVKPYDMATAFGVFANQGIKQPLIAITKVTDWKGKVLDEVNIKDIELAGDRVLNNDVTFLVSHVLHDNNARSAAFGASSLLNVKGHPEVSVKTGTTNDFKDNWTIGYTRHALTVTWVGNNDNTPMGGAASGISGASPIWNKIMREVLDKAEEGYHNEEDEGSPRRSSQSEEGHIWPQKPNEVVGAEVCTLSGIMPRADSPQAGCGKRFEYFLEDYIPTQYKGGVQEVHFDRTTGGFINEDTPPENIETRAQSVMYDPLDTFICLDCNIPVSSHSATIKYPLVIENNFFNQTGEIEEN